MIKLTHLLNLPKTWSQRLFVIALITVCAFNIPDLQHELKRIDLLSQVVTHQDIEYKFNGLSEIIQNAEYIGYYTDGNIMSKKYSKEFSHAQYALSPTILEYGNFQHEFMLLVCDDERKAWTIMKKYDAVPLRRNKFGMILAQRKGL